MQLTLEKIRIESIRDFKEVEIPLKREDDEDSITLLQMPNGTGKTTTINLLRYLLCGKVPAVVSTFRPSLFDAETGRFELTVRVDTRRFKLILDLDYGSNDAKISTVRIAHGGGGKDEGIHLDKGIRQMLSQSFVNLFIFDGELSKGLLDAKQTHADFAINSIYHIDRIHEVANSLIDIEIDHRLSGNAGTQVQSPQGLRAKQTRRDNLRKALEQLRNQSEDLQEQKANLHDTLEDLINKRKKLIEGRESVRNKSAELDQKLTEVNNNIEQVCQKILRGLSEPSAYCLRSFENIKMLGDHMQELRLPKNIAKDFFIEIARQDQCICGRKLDEDSRVFIIENAEQYLSEEDITLGNAIKNVLTSLTRFEGNDKDVDLLKKFISKRTRLRQEQAQLKQTMPLSEQEKVEDIEIQMDEVKRQQNDISDTLDGMTTIEPGLLEQVDEKDNIYKCEKALEKISAELAEATDSVLFKRKAEHLKRMLGHIAEKALSRLKEDVISDTNTRLEKILGHGDLVRVRDVHGAILLEEKEDVSEGQRLSLAYAFLSTLFSKSSVQVPFVVDSPAGKLDYDVRREVGNMIPELFDQLVFFIISSEKPAFVSRLGKSGKALNYLTVHKSKEDSSILYVNNTKEYFDMFQSDEEETL